MKGRSIFGELVPYESLWRTGANKVTRISFSTDVQVNGEPVSKGDYALLTIPGEASWTIILNSETEMWGTGSYSEDNDVLRTEVAASASNNVVETFSMEIRDICTRNFLRHWDRMGKDFGRHPYPNGCGARQK